MWATNSQLSLENESPAKDVTRTNLKEVDNVLRPDAFDFDSFQDEHLFQWDNDKRRVFQERYIYAAFNHHYENCPDYRHFAERHGITPNSLKAIDEIPQIPTVLFKNIDILSIPRNDVAKVCQSSGTRGLMSVVYRDEKTLDRLLCSIIAGMKYIYDIDNDRALVLNLGPSTEEAGDIWFSYVTSIADLLYKTYYYVTDQEFYVEDLVGFLTRQKKVDKRIILLGAPIMFKRFLSYLERDKINLHLPSDTLVITAGGWKKFSGEALERNRLEKLLCERLRIRPENVRDSFNQVELNTVIFECEYKNKHAPPWVKVIIRDPVTMADIGEEQAGVLTYLDASCRSYPCFIISEDIGRVRSGCACGRKGQILDVIRRVNRVESKGCAIKMDSYVAEEG